MKKDLNVLDRLENVAHAIHDKTVGDEWQKKRAVAASFGYVDAKYMRHLHETYGLSVADQVVILKQQGSMLKIPWMGLQHELLCMGMKESVVEAMLNEAKEFERIATIK